MSFLDILGGVNCGLVFFFGAALSVSIAGGCKARQEWYLLFALCPVFLAIQTVSWLMFGLDATKQLYPLLIHLPLLLVLVFGLKRPAGMSLVSICAAYLCCQLPRYGAITIQIVTGSPLVGQAVYTAIIGLIFLFLLRYFLPSARETMAESPKAMLLFGSLPILYYFYDYTVAVHFSFLYVDLFSSNFSYSSSQVVSEMLPCVFGIDVEYKRHVRYVYVDYEPSPDFRVKQAANYRTIRTWVLREYGLTVSSPQVKQTKRKHGVITQGGQSRPLPPGKEPIEVPSEKEAAIEAALRHFGMIPEN